MYTSSLDNLFKNLNMKFSSIGNANQSFSSGNSWYSTLNFLSTSSSSYTSAGSSWYSNLNGLGSSFSSGNNSYFSSKYNLDTALQSFSYTSLGSMFGSEFDNGLSTLNQLAKDSSGSGNNRALKEINGSDQNDTLTTENSGTYATVHGYNGNDVITALHEAFISMFGDAGNDTFSFTKDSAGVIRGGDGTDTVDISDYYDATAKTIKFADLGTDKDGNIYLKTENGTMVVKSDVEVFQYTIGNQKVSTSYDELKKLIASNNTETVQNMTNTTKNGTDEGNFITVNNGNNSKVNLLSGDDTLNITNSKLISADLGVGKDTLTTDKSTQIAVNGHDGDDELISRNSGLVSLYGGAGNDKLTAENGTDTNILSGEGGNNTFTVTNEKNVSLLGGTGNDTFNIDTKSAGSAKGDVGADTAILAAAFLKSTNIIDTGKVKLNSKNEIVLLNQNGEFVLATDIENIQFAGQTTTNTYNSLSQKIVEDALKHVDNVSGQTYNGSKYVENIFAKNGSNNIFNFQDSVDILNFQSQTNGIVNLAGGADVLYGTTVTTSTIKGGTGDDYLNVNNGTSSIIMAEGDKDSITLMNGTGNKAYGGDADDILIIANEKEVNLFGDAGNDTFSIDALSTGTIAGGAGTDTIFLNNGEKLTSFENFRLSTNGEIVIIKEDSGMIIGKDIENIAYIDDKGASVSKTYDQFKEFIAQTPTTYTNLTAIDLTGTAFNDNIKLTNVTKGQYLLGEGHDTLELDSTSSGRVIGGLGNDTIILSGLIKSDGSVDYSKLSVNNKNELVVKHGNDFIIIQNDVENIKLKKSNGTFVNYTFATLQQNILNKINDASIYTNIVTGSAGIFSLDNKINGVINGTAGNDNISINKLSSGKVSGGTGEDIINLSNLFDTSFTTANEYLTYLKNSNNIFVNNVGQIVIKTDAGEIVLATDIEKLIFSGNTVNFMTYDDAKLALAA